MAQPKWRFMREDGTEFPEWEELTLGNRFTFKNGINASREAFRTAGIHCIGVSDVIKCLPILATNVIGTVSISDKEVEKNKVNYGDILFQRSSETQQDIGHASVYIDNTLSVYNGFVICGKPDKLFYNPIFLHNALQIYKVRKQTISLGAGAQHYNIGQEALAQIKVNIPCLEEQKRIADFLSAVDEVIAQSEVEIQNLEQHKKAVMQKIFSQEVRFRREDGGGFPEWEEKAITELCESILGGGTPTTENKDYWNGDIAWVSSSDLDNNDIHHLSITRFITEEAIRCSATKKIPCDSVLIVSRVGVGKVVVAPCELCTSQDFTNIVNPKCNSLFLGYMLSIIMQIKANGVQGTSIKGVTAKEIKQYRISIPCLQEQQKIADFLSACDESISYAKQELDKWKDLKKGLLQQMFV